VGPTHRYESLESKQDPKPLDKSQEEVANQPTISPPLKFSNISCPEQQIKGKLEPYFELLPDSVSSSFYPLDQLIEKMDQGYERTYLWITDSNNSIVGLAAFNFDYQ